MKINKPLPGQLELIDDGERPRHGECRIHGRISTDNGTLEIEKAGEYELVCAELCGWGHYKMKARIIAESEESYTKYLAALETDQNEDGVADDAAESDEE